MTKGQDEWISLFQWFHRHPELGYEEVETTARIRAVLAEQDIEIVPSELQTGLIAVIKGAKPGRVVCLRADIDALPVEEQTNLDYASKYKGKMHACGHDFHTVTALYIASLLRERQNEICGTIYIVFQPAEEVIGGARKVLRTGILTEVEEFYGFHAEPSLRVGEVSCVSGTVMASVDQFSITVTGKGCHGATPWQGSNPIPILTSMVNDIYKIIRDESGKEHSKVLSVTHIEAGNAWNVIPEQAYLEGTVRTLYETERRQIKSAVYEIAEQQGEKSDAAIVVQWREGPSAVVNDEELSEFVKKELEEKNIVNIKLPSAMVGEDFSEYKKQIGDARSLYLKVGTGIGAALHQSTFCVDPAAIKVTAELYTAIILERVRG